MKLSSFFGLRLLGSFALTLCALKGAEALSSPTTTALPASAALAPVNAAPARTTTEPARTTPSTAVAPPPSTASAKPKNLLFIGQAKGYQHESISTAMVTLFQLGRQTGLWNTTLRTDCTAITKKSLKWEAKNLSAFDAIVFFTDGDLDLDESQKADLLSFVRDDGKGFIGIHSAAITFTSWPDYGQMLGGYFDAHPWGIFQAPLKVEDATFPGLNFLPASFDLRDEIYQIKNFSRTHSRVLLSLDTAKLDLTRPGVKSTDQGFPVIWAHNYGKGRVLYNGLGHVDAVWQRLDMQQMWIELVKWSLGLTPGDATPRPSSAP